MAGSMSDIEALIERRAAETLAEIRRMAMRAYREIDAKLGVKVGFTNRSRGQRARWERTRQTKGAL